MKLNTKETNIETPVSEEEIYKKSEPITLKILLQNQHEETRNRAIKLIFEVYTKYIDEYNIPYRFIKEIETKIQNLEFK